MPDTPPSSPLPCDCCGADMQARLDELIHVSGTLNDQECNHIHLCPQCAAGLSLPRIAVAPGKVEQMPPWHAYRNTAVSELFKSLPSWVSPATTFTSWPCPSEKIAAGVIIPDEIAAGSMQEPKP